MDQLSQNYLDFHHQNTPSDKYQDSDDQVPDEVLDDEFQAYMDQIEIEKSRKNYLQKGIEEDVEKWEGTGLEDLVGEQNSYRNPIQRRKDKRAEEVVEVRIGYSGMQEHLNMESKLVFQDKSKQSLFQKTSNFKIPHLENKSQKQVKVFSRKLVQEGEERKMTYVEDVKNLMVGMKEMNQQSVRENRIMSYSKFFTPKQLALSLKRTNTYVSRQLQISIQRGEDPLPKAKEWFQQLDLDQRVLAVSTVDSKIVDILKNMYRKKTQKPKMYLKFLLVKSESRVSTSIRSTEQGSFQTNNFPKQSFIVRDSPVSIQPSAEVINAEEELLRLVLISDAEQMHDTLTFSEDLFRDVDKFCKLGEKIAGSNFLKTPHNVMIPQIEKRSQLETELPPWLDLQEANSLAKWVLYYIERALFIQYQNCFKGVSQSFAHFQRPEIQHLFIMAEERPIKAQIELKPFWRQFCIDSISDSSQSNRVLFLDRLREKIQAYFTIPSKQERDQQKAPKLDQFTGGLMVTQEEINSDQTRLVLERQEQFINKVNRFIVDFQEEGHQKEQLDLSRICHDSLDRASGLKQELMDPKELILELVWQRDRNGEELRVAEQNMEMKLWRIFSEAAREQINFQLKSQFTTSNKKVQKRKIKKLKEREQQMEKEREIKINQDKIEALRNYDFPEDKIHVTAPNVAQLLIGQEVKQKTEDEAKQVFQQIKESKKQGRKKKGKEQINFTVPPLKPSTPKQTQQQVLPQTSSEDLIDAQHNYFKLFGHKIAGGSQLSSDISAVSIEKPNQINSNTATLKTVSTCEESKDTPLIQDTEEAFSNQDVIRLKAIGQRSFERVGNAQTRRIDWQRGNKEGRGCRDLVDQLIDGDQRKESVEIEIPLIVVAERDNLLYCEKDSSQGAISDRVGSHSLSSVNSKNKLVILSKGGKKSEPKNKVSSSSESDGAEDEDNLLPQVFTDYEPRDNQSSDYEANEENEDEDSDDIRPKLSQDRPSDVKNQAISNKKSTKSAHPQMEQFKRNLDKSQQITKTEEVNEIQDVIKQNQRKRKKGNKHKGKHKAVEIPIISPCSIKYLSLSKTYISEWVDSSGKKKKPKNKREDKTEEKKEIQEPVVQQFEIIRPTVETKQKKHTVIKKDQKVDAKKPKKGNQQQNHQDAINQFIQSKFGAQSVTSSGQINNIPPQKSKEDSGKKRIINVSQERENIVEEVKVKKGNYQVKKQVQSVEENKQGVNQQVADEKAAGKLQLAERLFHDDAKSSRSERMPKDTSNQQQKNEEQEKSSLNQNSEKTSKKSRKKRCKKKNGGELQEESKTEGINWQTQSGEDSQIDRLSQMLQKKLQEMMQIKQQKQQKGTQNFQQYQMMYPNHDIDYKHQLDIQHQQQINFSQQLQDLLVKFNAEQQRQLAEIHLRQQQEAEWQLHEECEPCPEIDQERCDLFFENLENEMKAKVKEIDQLRDSVRRERQGFINIVEEVVKDTFANKYGNGFVGIKIFGSMATELAIETSDVDLVVTGIIAQNSSPQSQHQGFLKPDLNKNQLLKMMQKLYDNLLVMKAKGMIHKAIFIQGANVPIIKLVADLQDINNMQVEKAQQQRLESKRNGEGIVEVEVERKEIKASMRYLKVDISIEEGTDNMGYVNYLSSRSHSGIETIYHIQKLVLERKDLRPIVMIIKKIFDETFLSMPYYGGISSYSLVLMVAAFLKRYDEDKLESLSRNLSGFLHFYGVGFKPHLYYLNGDQIEFCEDPNLRPFTDPFIVMDPLDNRKNISHATFRIKDIQQALVMAYKIINESCENFQLKRDLERSSPRAVLERLMSEIRGRYSTGEMSVFEE